MSTPSSSNVTTSSLRPFACSFSSRTSRLFLVRSSCLMVKRSPLLAFTSRMPSVISSICSRIKRSWRSMLIGIRSNCECPMMTASMSLVAIRAQNFLRLRVSKSFLVVTRIFAAGYSLKNSAAVCSVKWFGTTNIDLWHKPRRLLSIAAAIISNVFPAPTSCASRVFPPYSTCAIALN